MTYAKSILQELRSQFVRVEGDFGTIPSRPRLRTPRVPRTPCWSSVGATWKRVGFRAPPMARDPRGEAPGRSGGRHCRVDSRAARVREQPEGWTTNRAVCGAGFSLSSA